MEYKIWTIDCDTPSELEKKSAKNGLSYNFIHTSSDKLELIEYVDENIDLIYICGNQFIELKNLIYFFREFNQLLEHIPIIIRCDFKIFKQLAGLSTVGILDHVQSNANVDEIVYRFNHNCSFILKTEDIRKENLKYRTELKDHYNQLQYEMKRSEELLLNILPEETSRELMIHGYARPQTYRKVSVLFTDFKGFTTISESMKAEDLIKELDFYFSKFDEITSNHFGEKIKTIGDAYMCAGGIPLRNHSNPIDMVLIGLEMQQFMEETNTLKMKQGEPTWNLRVGIHTGRIVAGVIGKKKFAYDIWGDTVNTAARMESSGEPFRVNISGKTYGYVKDLFNCTYRGKVAAKNKGEIDMYFVDAIKPEFSLANEGLIPNEKFNMALSQL